MSFQIIIYVLKLERGYYYVGQTKNLEKRLKQHKKGNGCEWTKVNSYQSLYDSFTYEVTDEAKAMYWELHHTIIIMKEKGWRFVRGGYWSYISEEQTLKSLHHHGYFKEETLSSNDYSEYISTIYVLKLEAGNFFVSFTRNMPKTIKKHKNGKGSKWTSLHKFIELIEANEVISNTELELLDKVDQIVLMCFEKYGFENVRGGRFKYLQTSRHLEQIKNLNLFL